MEEGPPSPSSWPGCGVEWSEVEWTSSAPSPPLLPPPALTSFSPHGPAFRAPPGPLPPSRSRSLLGPRLGACAFDAQGGGRDASDSARPDIATLDKPEILVPRVMKHSGM